MGGFILLAIGVYFTYKVTSGIYNRLDKSIEKLQGTIMPSLTGDLTAIVGGGLKSFSNSQVRNRLKDIPGDTRKGNKSWLSKNQEEESENSEDRNKSDAIEKVKDNNKLGVTPGNLSTYRNLFGRDEKQDERIERDERAYNLGLGQIMRARTSDKGETQNLKSHFEHDSSDNKMIDFKQEQNIKKLEELLGTSVSSLVEQASGDYVEVNIGSDSKKFDKDSLSKMDNIELNKMIDWMNQVSNKEFNHQQETTKGFGIKMAETIIPTVIDTNNTDSLKVDVVSDSSTSTDNIKDTVTKKIDEPVTPFIVTDKKKEQIEKKQERKEFKKDIKDSLIEVSKSTLAFEKQNIKDAIVESTKETSTIDQENMKGAIKDAQKETSATTKKDLRDSIISANITTDRIDRTIQDRKENKEQVIEKREEMIDERKEIKQDKLDKLHLENLLKTTIIESNKDQEKITEMIVTKLVSGNNITGSNGQVNLSTESLEKMFSTFTSLKDQVGVPLETRQHITEISNKIQQLTQVLSDSNSTQVMEQQQLTKLLSSNKQQFDNLVNEMRLQNNK